jgi:hypothetical protein
MRLRRRLIAAVALTGVFSALGAMTPPSTAAGDCRAFYFTQ